MPERRLTCQDQRPPPPKCLVVATRTSWPQREGLDGYDMRECKNVVCTTSHAAPPPSWNTLATAKHSSRNMAIKGDSKLATSTPQERCKLQTPLSAPASCPNSHEFQLTYPNPAAAAPPCARGPVGMCGCQPFTTASNPKVAPLPSPTPA